MGNHRLRLSDMMPNAWFCRLKYMKQLPTKKTTTNPPPQPQAQSPHLQQPLIPNRASYYFPSNSSYSSSPLLHPKAFDTHFPLDSPRKSTTQLKPPRRIPATVTSSSSSSSSLSLSSSYRGSVSESDSDVQSHCITKNVSTAHINQLDLELELPPIITKPTTTAKESTTTIKPKKAAPATRRLRMRTSASSPRTRPSGKKVRAVREKKKKSGGILYSESFAVVKSTSDPRSDFRESMAEMVVENGLSSSNDLEDLLACYLSLNSNEYHHVIVEAFREIWFDRHHYCDRLC